MYIYRKLDRRPQLRQCCSAVPVVPAAGVFRRIERARRAWFVPADFRFALPYPCSPTLTLSVVPSARGAPGLRPPEPILTLFAALLRPRPSIRTLFATLLRPRPPIRTLFGALSRVECKKACVFPQCGRKNSQAAREPQKNSPFLSLVRRIRLGSEER